MSTELRKEERVAGSIGLRVTAALLDVVIVMSLFTLVAMHFGKELADGNRGWTGLPALIVFACIGAYWLISEWLFAATIGKAICDLRVVSIDGSRGKFVPALQRNLLRPVDGVGMYLVGFIVAMSNPRRQRLGDMWARTMVVSSRKTEGGNVKG